PAGHLSIEDVVSSALRSLAFTEMPIPVAVEDRVAVGSRGALEFREVPEPAKGARCPALHDRPVQAVLLARITNELLSILLHFVATVRFLEVLALRAGDGFARVHGGQVVLSESRRQDFVLTSGGVEVPLARRIPVQWNGKGTVARADLENLTAGFDRSPSMHLVVGGHEIIQPGFVRANFSREQDRATARPEDRDEPTRVIGFGRCQKTGARVLR